MAAIVVSTKKRGKVGYEGEPITYAASPLYALVGFKGRPVKGWRGGLY